MKVIVLGAGLLGVTSAYFLRQQGHEVTVIEQHDSVAEGASFANAGVVAPGYVTPWAAPGMPGKWCACRSMPRGWTWRTPWPPARTHARPS